MNASTAPDPVSLDYSYIIDGNFAKALSEYRHIQAALGLLHQLSTLISHGHMHTGLAGHN